MINFLKDSLFSISNASNKNNPTLLIFPVHIVVLNGRHVLNKHNWYPIKKETRFVTIISGKEVGSNPIINNEIASNIRANFLQSPLKLKFISIVSINLLNAAPNIQVKIGIK